MLCALVVMAWLLQDAREEVARAVLGRRGRQQAAVAQSDAAPVTSSTAVAQVRTQPDIHPTQLEAQTDAGSSNSSGDTTEWRLQQPSQQRSSSPSQYTAQPHSAAHSRHTRTAHDTDRDREKDREKDRTDKEWRDRGYDRHDRGEREREREQPRRRSRYEDEEDSAYMAAGGYSYYRSERDREERERVGSREAYREKEMRRRPPRDRDGHSSFHAHSNGDGRPSLSPTHPTHPSLSLPSPGHRHHQSFSSLHSHVPPSPSHASFYATEPSSSSSMYESSMSSLPSASMLSSAASFSQLSSPSHNSELATRPSPLTSSSLSPSVVVIGEGDFLWTLARGCELVKYGHYGSPHVRWFQIEVVHGVCRLSWGERRGGGSGTSSGHHALNLTKSIKLDDILDVRPGKQTPVFKQSRNDKIATDEQCCFSIITQKRSLDLQAKDRQQRDEWVSGLRHTLSDRQQQQHASQQQKLIVAAMAVQQQQQQQQQQHGSSSHSTLAAPQL